MNKIRVIEFEGRRRFVPDPDGVEAWTVSHRHYKHKPGRKPQPNHKVRINLTISQEHLNWLLEHGGITVAIEQLINEKMIKKTLSDLPEDWNECAEDFD